MQEQQIQRWRDGAEAAVATICSNEMTGFRRVVDTTVRDYSDQIDEWTAIATVEYINTAGGVARTNLDLKFTSFSGHITALIDYQVLRDKEIERIKKDQERRDRELADDGVKLGLDPYPWTFKKGGTLAAFYDSVKGTNLIVRRKTGKQGNETYELYSLPLDSLCDEDQALVQRLK
jgi:hypothetical protein